MTSASLFRELDMPANRRRFRREGVALIDGHREQLFLLPIQSRYPIFVKPAYRSDNRKPTWLEQLLEKFFSLHQ